MKLNLGCSDALLPGYVNVDIWQPLTVPAGCDFLKRDLRRIWIWPESSIDEIRAHDCIEHLPDKIHTMNEAWRVLKPGGRFDLFVPTTDGRGAFQDPTHVSFWTPNDLFYYTVGIPERERFGAAYGVVARFRIVSQAHTKFPNEVWKLRALLEAVK